jgi:hypothetical protein
METLAPSVEQFLERVSWVSELETIDAELVAAGDELCARLTRSEDAGDAEEYDATLKRLGMVGMLRGEIARELNHVRETVSMQVLAKASEAQSNDDRRDQTKSA